MSGCVCVVRAGYSFVAPSILFTENVMAGRDSTRRSAAAAAAAVGRGGDEAALACVSPFFKKYTINLKDNYLGNGSFSICRRCQDRRTKKMYAVKIISKLHDSTVEINMLRRCQGVPLSSPLLLLPPGLSLSRSPSSSTLSAPAPAPAPTALYMYTVHSLYPFDVDDDYCNTHPLFT